MASDIVIFHSADAIPKAIKRIRSSRFMTQYELSQATGIKQSQLARYEAGTSIPRADTLIRILNHLDYNLLADPKPPF